MDEALLVRGVAALEALVGAANRLADAFEGEEEPDAELPARYRRLQNQLAQRGLDGSGNAVPG